MDTKQRAKRLVLFIFLIPLFDLLLEQLSQFTSFYHSSFLGGLGVIPQVAMFIVLPYAIGLFYIAYKFGRKTIIYLVLFLLLIAATSYSGLKYSLYMSKLTHERTEQEQNKRNQDFANNIKLTIVKVEKIPDQQNLYWVTVKTTINKSYANREKATFNISFNDNDQLYLYNTGFSFDLLSKEKTTEIKKPHVLLKIENNIDGDTEIVMVYAIEYRNNENNPVLNVNYLLKALEKDDYNNQSYKEYNAIKNINIINAIALSE